MSDLARLTFALVVLLLTLGIGLAYLSSPIAIARRTGVVSVGKFTARAGWRVVVGLIRTLTKARKPRIRRPSRPHGYGRSAEREEGLLETRPFKFK